MGSLTKDRAARVCNTCKVRKKACDKQVPICGYCVKRGLSCNYNDSSTNSATPISPNTSSASVSVILTSESSTLRNLLSQEVSRILKLSGLSLLQLSQHFFQTFHTWFPVISPRLFHETAFVENHGVLPADFSALILAMCLITQRPHLWPVEPHVSHEDLYVTVKVLFAQSQAVLPLSHTLVQTAILITTYEYVSGRPDAAYISIGSCIRMAQTIGLADITSTEQASLLDDYSVYRALEERNLWWAIVILERIIIFEVPSGNQNPTTQYPCLDTPLPSDLEIEEQFHSQPLGPIALTSPLLGDLRATDIGYFARHAQATYLLDQFLIAISSLPDREVRYSELLKIDQNVQSFLSLLMSEDRWAKRFGCGAIASSIRLLFLLHQYNLSQSTPAELEADGRKRERMSHAALNTATRIMVDVAETLLQTGRAIETMPLCCAYICRVAHEHMKNEGKDSFWETQARDLAPLLAVEKFFKTRWTASLLL